MLVESVPSWDYGFLFLWLVRMCTWLSLDIHIDSGLEKKQIRNVSTQFMHLTCDRHSDYEVSFYTCRSQRLNQMRNYSVLSLHVFAAREKWKRIEKEGKWSLCSCDTFKPQARLHICVQRGIHFRTQQSVLLSIILNYGFELREVSPPKNFHSVTRRKEK